MRLNTDQDEKGILRVKMDVLPGSYQAASLDGYVAEATKNHKRPTLEGLLGYEQSHYKDIMGETFHKVKGPVEFGVRDMMVGKCLFSGIDKINACADELKEVLSKSTAFSLYEV